MGERRTDVIRTKTRGYVYIDTNYTFDRGWETMVFPCTEDGHVTDWGDLDADWYDSISEANIGHDNMINEWIHK